MKHLYILRHAKSSWAHPGLSDIERPLNRRGERQLSNLNRWLSVRHYQPDIVLCSPSNRTQLTFQGIRTALGMARLVTESSLYSGFVDSYLSAIWAQTADQIMLIGHNPTCDELTRYLTAPDSPAAEKMMSHHFGTANLAIFEVELNSWSALGRSSASLVDIIRPKDIEPSDSR